MNLILLAVPFFFLLIALELVADRVRGVSTYRLADSLNSLSAGVLSQTSGLLSKAIAVLGYAFAYEHLHLTALPDEPWVWVLAFVFYDFCYYWNHRIGHERNIFWASHVVHHQSEDYNLSTALRQTSTGFLLSWIFYLPMAVAGVPVVSWHGAGSLDEALRRQAQREVPEDLHPDAAHAEENDRAEVLVPLRAEDQLVVDHLDHLLDRYPRYRGAGRLLTHGPHDVRVCLGDFGPAAYPRLYPADVGLVGYLG